ncbi:hypothetical protein QP178_20000 [Sphingomonas aurantiaca]|uniref:hypothetical protein n=1 Tax=Sphingomonas aurantiaca TaxID=185949 RepID=UPI0010D0C71B|nr:MAG: hypothetical protein EOO38_16040 [Cytophagaceae bacterium]
MDEIQPVSGGGEVDYDEEAVRQLVVAGGDGTVDLEVAEHAPDAVALFLKNLVMLNLYSSV